MPLRTSPLRAAGSISLATLVSRILGLVRDQVQSYYFGAGVTTDAFVTAFRIPNLLRDLFAEGALSSAFVPTLTAEAEHAGPAAAWRLVNRVITALIVVLGAVTVAIFLLAPWILAAYAHGFSPEKMALAVTMTRIMAPFLLLVALAAVAMGVLNTRGRFFLPALAPAAFNVAVIVGIIALYPVLRAAGLHPGLALAIGAMVGGAAQFAVQVPAMMREGFRFHLDLALSDPGLRRVARLMLPAVFGLAATQISIFVDTTLASGLGDGPITWLALAFRLMQLPIGLFGVAIATANLAYVSRDVARGDNEALRSNLAGSLRAAALLALPAAAGLVALSQPIVRVIFQHGVFSAQSTAKTAAAVTCYAFGLYAYAVTKIQVPTFYALGEPRIPVMASGVAVALKVVTSLVLIRLLPHLGFDAYLGLALSTSLAAWTNFALLAVGIRRRVGTLRGHAVVAVTLKLALLAVVVGAACAAAHAGLARLVGAGGLGTSIVVLGLAVALGVALTAVGAYLLGVDEARAIVRRMRAVLAGRRP